MGSSPDPFGAGAYNLQSISALRPKGLVHETNHQKQITIITDIVTEGI